MFYCVFFSSLFSVFAHTSVFFPSMLVQKTLSVFSNKISLSLFITVFCCWYLNFLKNICPLFCYFLPIFIQPSTSAPHVASGFASCPICRTTSASTAACDLSAAGFVARVLAWLPGSPSMPAPTAGRSRIHVPTVPLPSVLAPTWTNTCERMEI